MDIRGGTTVEIRGNAGIDVNSAGITSIKGSIVKLNEGTQPAARIGSKTVGNQASQTVTDGDATVLVPKT